MKPASRTPLAIVLASAFTVALLTTAAHGDVIMDWNAKADAIGTEKQVPNAPNARGQAMLHVAMFEAVNAIDKRYTPYKLALTAESNYRGRTARHTSHIYCLIGTFLLYIYKTEIHKSHFKNQ